jgi:hypothetical protein
VSPGDSSRRKRRILLFLSLILIPTTLLVAFAFRLVRQDAELAETRSADLRREAVEGLRRDLAERLEGIKSQEVNRWSPDSERETPQWIADSPVVFVAPIIQNRMLLPWDLGDERVSAGRSLREYSREKFFEPLGMRHTHFHDDRNDVVENRALAYSATDEGFIVNWSPTFDQVGSDGLLSTIEGLVEWDRSYYDGLLGLDFWQKLEEPGTLRDGEELNYAFGLFLDEYRGHRRVQHGGSMFGYRAQLSRFPDAQLTVAILCNLASMNPAQRSEAVADLFLPVEGQTSLLPQGEAFGDSAERVPIELSVAQLDTWTGEYETANGFVLDILRDGDRLMATVRGIGDLKLEAVSENEFLVIEASPTLSASHVRFAGAEGELSLVVVDSREEITAVLAAPGETDPARLEAWTGRYWSEELGATVLIGSDSDKLTYQIGSADTLVPDARSDWSLSLRPGVRVQGKYNPGDRLVEGFVMDASGASGIQFVRQETLESGPNE